MLAELCQAAVVNTSEVKAALRQRNAFVADEVLVEMVESAWRDCLSMRLQRLPDLKEVDAD